jgi:transcription factor C subunit 6
VLWGRWIKGKIPYGGIEEIRKESDGDGAAMDVDSEESDVASS